MVLGKEFALVGVFDSFQVVFEDNSGMTTLLK